MRQKSRAGGLIAAAAPVRQSVKVETADLPAGHNPTPVVVVPTPARQQETAAQTATDAQPARADTDVVSAVQVRITSPH